MPDPPIFSLSITDDALASIGTILMGRQEIYKLNSRFCLKGKLLVLNFEFCMKAISQLQFCCWYEYEHGL